VMLKDRNLSRIAWFLMVFYAVLVVASYAFQ